MTDTEKPTCDSCGKELAVTRDDWVRNPSYVCPSGISLSECDNRAWCEMICLGHQLANAEERVARAERSAAEAQRKMRADKAEIRAVAWDEGHAAGRRSVETTNPYRVAGQTDQTAEERADNIVKAARRSLYFESTLKALLEGESPEVTQCVVAKLVEARATETDPRCTCGPMHCQGRQHHPYCPAEAPRKP